MNKRMVWNTFIFFTCTLMLAVPHVQGTTLSSTFDTDLEGWSGTGVQLTHITSGGNPGGFLQANDLPFTSFLQAPGTFSGDLSEFDGGTLSFDIKVFSTDLPPAGQGGNVTLRSGTTAVTSNVIDVPSLPVPSAWTSGAVPFTASAWGLEQAAWTQLLSDVTAIEVIVDPSFGGNNRDISGFDNFRLASAASVPEPATVTMLLAGLGLLGVVAKRTKRVS